MTEIKTNCSGISQIKIADEVIAIIAGTAALEVEGVAALSGLFKGDFSEILGKKNLAKGVTIKVDEDQVFIEMNILVNFGHQIQDVCLAIQKKVKSAVETMTGLVCQEVNVNVTGIHQEKDKPAY